MPASAWLSISVTARVSKLLAGFAKATAAVKRFAKRVGRMARAVRRAALTFGLLGVAAYLAFKRIATAGEMFNRKMRRSLAIMTGMTTALRDKMVKAAIDIASKTIFSTQQAAESYFFLASAGLDAKRSLEALSTVAQFAQAGMFNMARATELLTDAQSALGMTVKTNSAANMRNMLRVSDVLVKANSIANATTEQFSEALTTRAAMAMRSWGISVEEGVATLAAFADQGTKAAEAGTAYDIVIRDLTRSGVRAALAGKKYGISVYDETEKFRSLAKIIGDLEDTMTGMSDKRKKIMLIDMTFQERSIAHMLKLIGMSRNIVRYQALLERAGGSTKRIAEMQLTPLEKALAKLQSAWTEVSLAMQPFVGMAAMAGVKLANYLKTFANAEGVKGLVTHLANFFNWLDDRWVGLQSSFHSFVQVVSKSLAALFDVLADGVGMLGRLLDKMMPGLTGGLGFAAGVAKHGIGWLLGKPGGFGGAAGAAAAGGAASGLALGGSTAGGGLKLLAQEFRDTASAAGGMANSLGVGPARKWGDRLAAHLEVPTKLITDQIRLSFVEGIKDAAAVQWALLKSDWERSPVRAATGRGLSVAIDAVKALYNPAVGLPALLTNSRDIMLAAIAKNFSGGGGASAGIMPQRDISISRHAIAGLNVDATGKRVTDEKLEKIFVELTKQTKLLGGPARTSP